MTPDHAPTPHPAWLTGPQIPGMWAVWCTDDEAERLIAQHFTPALVPDDRQFKGAL